MEYKIFSFPRREKIKSCKLIESLFRHGNTFIIFPYRIFYLPQIQAKLTSPILQVGFSVSSKKFPRAVDRNKIKRLGRECWRLQKYVLRRQLILHQQQLAVFLVYIAKRQLAFVELYSSISKILYSLQQQDKLF